MTSERKTLNVVLPEDRKTVSLRSIWTLSASQAEMCMELSGKREGIYSLRDMRGLSEWVKASVNITFVGTDVVGVEFMTVDARNHPWYGMRKSRKYMHDIKKIRAAFRKYLRTGGVL